MKFSKITFRLVTLGHALLLLPSPLCLCPTSGRVGKMPQLLAMGSPVEEMVPDKRWRRASGGASSDLHAVQGDDKDHDLKELTTVSSIDYHDAGADEQTIRKLQSQNTWTQRGDEILGEGMSGSYTDIITGIEISYPGDMFGQSVDLSSDGTVLAVGAPNNESPGWTGINDFGHVRVYQLTNSVWTQLGGDIDGKSAGDRAGYSVSLSSNGSVVAVGSVGASCVRVYQYVSGGWAQLGSDIVGEVAQDGFGISVSLSSDGNVLAVGAQGNDPSSRTDAGHARVYRYIGGSWTQVGGDIDGEATGDYSGSSVALSSSGNVLAVGAARNDPSGRTDAGHVRVYQLINTNTWMQLGGDIDGEATGDYSGGSVALSGDGTILAVGASGYSNLSSTYAGHARVYQFSSGLWVQRGSKISGTWGQRTGSSVSLSTDGSILAVGEPGYSYWNPYPTTLVQESGCVRVYRYENNDWTQQGNFIVGKAAGDKSGYSVSLSSNGNVLAIGAPYHDITTIIPGKKDGGHVRVYQSIALGASSVPTRSPTRRPTAKPTRSPTRRPTAKPLKK